MKSNKYLTQVISGLEKTSGLLTKSIGFVDDVIGGTANSLAEEAKILSKAHITGRTAQQAVKDASKAHSRMIKARVKTGIGGAVLGSAGFLGIHKYHQHRDNAILEKINNMYADQHNTN